MLTNSECVLAQPDAEDGVIYHACVVTRSMGQKSDVNPATTKVDVPKARTLSDREWEVELVDSFMTRSDDESQSGILTSIYTNQVDELEEEVSVPVTCPLTPVVLVIDLE